MSIFTVRKIEIFLIQVVFELHHPELEVHAIESFNSFLSFISHLEPKALIRVIGVKAFTMMINENRSNQIRCTKSQIYHKIIYIEHQNLH